MPVYVCRKDGTDLTAAVQRAIDDEGPGMMNIDTLVEGLTAEGDASRGEQTFLAGVSEARDDLITVVVICPTDDEANRFVVRRRED
jgi:hypothetical protein